MERCSNSENKDKHLLNLKEKFEDRNYPSSLIDKQFTRAKGKNRKSLIFQNRKAKTSKDEKIRLIFTHNQDNPPIYKWLREGKRLLARNDKAKSMGDKLQVGWKQPKNLLRIAGEVAQMAARVPPRSRGWVF